MRKYTRFLSFIIGLCLAITLTGCKNTKSDFCEDDMSKMDEVGQKIIDDVKTQISQIMDFYPIYKEISPDKIPGYLTGRTLYKFVPEIGLVDSVDDICFYYDIAQNSLYLNILYHDDINILLQVYENNFTIVTASDKVSIWDGELLSPELFTSLKERVDETIMAYAATGEVLSLTDQNSLNAPNSLNEDTNVNLQYLAGVEISLKETYIFNSAEESFLVFVLNNSKEIDSDSVINLLGTKDGFDKNLTVYRDPDPNNKQPQLRVNYLSANLLSPFSSDDYNNLDISIPSMTMDINKETVLLFHLNWDGYEQYELSISNDETDYETDYGEVVKFVLEDSEIKKCSYEEYVANRYAELSSRLNNSNVLVADGYEITLNDINITSDNKNISATIKNVSTIPQSVDYIRVEGLDSNGRVFEFYSGNGLLIESFNPEEEVNFQWTDISGGTGFTDNCIVKVTMKADNSEGISCIYTFYTVHN